MFFLVGLVRFEKRVVVFKRRHHEPYTVERATKEKAKGDFFGGELTAMTSKGGRGYLLLSSTPPPFSSFSVENATDWLYLQIPSGRPGNHEIFDVYTFASFRWMMGILAGMMASTYSMALGVHAYYKAIGSSDRVYEEMAMFFGFLTLLFFSINLFGFWGIIWLPGFPLIVLVSAIIPF
ncbi:hypothetical protein DY000_02034503 [Brassica cretica]|uniref:Transmembrane 9 superfamily member n=1 Tax=Brassica cretica TaxID=69181 RepID=A0ABQ7DKH0_BRACR|nr:hypothetical protein DY000_02034503 [Brassica cretica]